MTDARDYRVIKETEALAKRLGFKLDYRTGGLTIIAAKGLPVLAFSKNEEIITPYTVEEVRAWLRGWANLVLALEDIGFDAAEYDKRLNDVKVLNALKGKKTR